MSYDISILNIPPVVPPVNEIEYQIDDGAIIPIAAAIGDYPVGFLPPGTYANRIRGKNLLGAGPWSNVKNKTIDWPDIFDYYGWDKGLIWDLDRMDHLFQLSNGVTPVTAYGDPVGLILTREQGGLDNLGVELAINGDFESGANWILGTGWSVAGGAAVGIAVPPAASLRQNLTITDGRAYAVTYTVTITTGTIRAFLTGGTSVGGVTRTASGTYTDVLRAVSGNNQVTFQPTAEFNGEIDNVSVREVPGVHLIQTVNARRMTYARRPKSGIRNLLQRTEEFENNYWNKNSLNTTGTPQWIFPAAGPDGQTAFKLILNNGVVTAGANTAGMNRVQAVTSGIYRISIFVKSAEVTSIRVRENAIAGNFLIANLSTQTITITSASNQQFFDALLTPAADGWFRLSFTTATMTNFSKYAFRANADGNGTDGVFATMPQYELLDATSPTPYQKVTSQFDVTESGVESINYLWDDGIDDCLVTASPIDWLTDEVTACLGASKLTDASQRTLLEFGPSIDLNNQSWKLTAPNSAAANYAARSRGTGIANAIASGFAAPDLAMLTMQAKIGTDLLTLKRNGVEVASSTDDQGTGNYGNVVINLGSRNQESQFFSGHINSGFIINQLPDPLVLSEIESWIAKKAGIDL